MKPESTEISLAIWNKKYDQGESKGDRAGLFGCSNFFAQTRVHTNEKRFLSTHCQEDEEEVPQSPD